jgi:hypothetical protein
MNPSVDNFDPHDLFCILCDSVIKTKTNSHTSATLNQSKKSQIKFVSAFCRCFKLSKSEEESINSIPFPFCSSCETSKLQTLSFLHTKLKEIQSEIATITMQVALAVIRLKKKSSSKTGFQNQGSYTEKIKTKKVKSPSLSQVHNTIQGTRESICRR